MTTAELACKIRQNRQSLNSKYIARLKKEINQIRKDIVIMSIQPKPDSDKHKDLITRLEAARIRLKTAMS